MPKRVSLKGKGADIFFGDALPTPELSSSPDEHETEQAAPTPAPPAASTARSSTSNQETPSRRASVRARTHARTQARGDAQTTAPVRTAMAAELSHKLSAKHRLASYTFRFRPEELDELELVLQEVASVERQKPSKNDVVRLALMWLLADYRENEDASVLAQVLARR